MKFRIVRELLGDSASYTVWEFPATCEHRETTGITPDVWGAIGSIPPSVEPYESQYARGTTALGVALPGVLGEWHGRRWVSACAEARELHGARGGILVMLTALDMRERAFRKIIDVEV